MRVLKIIATSGPIVLKRIDGSTYRSFLRIPAHVLFSAPGWSPSLPKLTQRLPLLTTPSLMLFCNVAAPMLLKLIIKATPTVWAIFIESHYPRPLKAFSSSLGDTSYKKEGIITKTIMKELKNKELSNNVTIKDELKHGTT